jgi:hypothetical protein
MADKKYKDYSALEKTYEYDREKASVLAEAVNEAAELGKRVKELGRLFTLNKSLHKFLWTDAAGKVTAFNDLEDDHLTNILSYQAANGIETPDELQAEARSRGISIPTANTAFRVEAGKQYNGVPVWVADEDEYKL